MNNDNLNNNNNNNNLNSDKLLYDDYSLPKVKGAENVAPRNVAFNFQNFKKTLKEVHKFITTASTKELLRFIVDLVLLLAIVILISLPFTLIIELGGNFIGLLNNEYIFNTWEILLNTLYTIAALYYYCVAFNKRFYNINERYRSHDKEN